MRKKLLFVLVALIFLVGCKNDKEIESTKLNVVVSIVPQATFVKKVGGDLVNVTTMIPPGNSPTNYEVKPKDMKELSKASLYFKIGVPTEEVNILPEIKNFNSEIKIIDLPKLVSEVYPERQFKDHENHEHEDEHEDEEEHEEHEEGRDQHIWLSPKRVIVMVDEITKELSLADPENKSVYRENAKKYKEDLISLDKHLNKTLSKLKNNTFLIYHPSLGYFADDYGLKMVSAEKEGKEATAKELKEIVDFAKKENIKVVFYQAEVHSKQSDILANEIGGESIEVKPLAGNYIENLTNIGQIFERNLNK